MLMEFFHKALHWFDLFPKYAIENMYTQSISLLTKFIELQRIEHQVYLVVLLNVVVAVVAAAVVVVVVVAGDDGEGVEKVS